MPHYHAIDAELRQLEARGLLRNPDGGEARAFAEATARQLGVCFVDASSNDYLGLGRNVAWRVSRSSASLPPPPAVDTAAVPSHSSLPRSGAVSRETLDSSPDLPSTCAGSGASRLVHGSRSTHAELESALASWVGQESALLFTSGFAANLGVIGALAGDGDVVLSDALNHASIIDGCRLSRAQVVKVPHLNVAELERSLSQLPHTAAKWFVTESYFSMDGDGPDLAAVEAICRRYGAGLIVDEAHALGIFGPAGAGRCAEARVRPDVLVGTFGKAVGTQGAFAACSPSIRSWLWNRARSFLFSTATSPVLAQISLFHVKRVQAMESERVHLEALGATLRYALGQAGVDFGRSFGPIVPVIVGSNARALRAASILAERGILTQAIRSPTVPPGTERLRVTLNSALRIQDVERLAQEISKACRES
ncbi:MAG: 8-amino-7-oxononanoate synthase [Polyangiaceae bacterium]|nr:8-amino-7-oxononanoate synthase [Polyangiaceae bacterium]